MIELFPLPFLTKMKTRSSSPYNRADRQNRKQGVRHKKQEARTNLSARYQALTLLPSVL